MSAPANGTVTQTPYDVLYGGSINLTATTFVSGISWGFMTSLYAVCMHSLIRNLRSRDPSRKTVLLTAWITILWVLSTLSSFANAYCTLYAYSWKLDYPGPIVYLNDEWNQPMPTLAYTTYALTMWFSDALMASFKLLVLGDPSDQPWRLVIFCSTTHSLARGLILSFMFLIYIASVGTGCLTIVLDSSNQSIYSANLAKKAAVSFFTLSVALNVLSTLLITIQVLAFKRLLERTLGKKQVQQSPYTAIATMLLESSALYAAWSLVFLVVYAVSNPGQYVMLMTLGNVQVIAPLLIVYRVSRGEETTSPNLTSTRSRPVCYDNLSKSDIIVTRSSGPEGSLDSSSQAIFANPSSKATSTRCGA